MANNKPPISEELAFIDSTMRLAHSLGFNVHGIPESGTNTGWNEEAKISEYHIRKNGENVAIVKNIKAVRSWLEGKNQQSR